MGRKLSAFKIRQLWWKKTTRNHIARLKTIGKWHGLPRLTLGEWVARWEQFDHRCAYCLEQFPSLRDVWIEHLVGIKEGGTHRIENCVPACPKCNQTKGDKSLEDFCGIKPEEFVERRLAELAERMKKDE